MPFDPTTEELLAPSAAARACREVFGSESHPATIYRWAVRGTRVAGRVVRLDAIRKGCRLFTSREALVRFRDATNAAATDDGERPDRVAPELLARSEAAIERLRAQAAATRRASSRSQRRGSTRSAKGGRR